MFDSEYFTPAMNLFYLDKLVAQDEGVAYLLKKLRLQDIHFYLPQLWYLCKIANSPLKVM